MGLKENLRKAAGLFVELPPEEATSSTDEILEAYGSERPAPATKTVAEIVRNSDGPNLEDIKVAAPPHASLASGGASGALDYDAIYQAAGLTPVAFTAEQMVDMLKSLPGDLPIQAKRQMVQVTLTAMGKSIGVSPESIVTDASRKMAALTAYAESLTSQTKDAVAATEREIDQLMAQIADRKQRVTAAQASLMEVEKRCTEKSDELDDVLEFFSLDVPPSKLASR
ncbi:MAG TPA: hypothetical protein VGK19_15680 [Capsulimonadaceae bacterium]|jgi:hypothetical protein